MKEVSLQMSIGLAASSLIVVQFNSLIVIYNEEIDWNRSKFSNDREVKALPLLRDVLLQFSLRQNMFSFEDKWLPLALKANNHFGKVTPFSRPMKSFLSKNPSVIFCSQQEELFSFVIQ